MSPPIKKRKYVEPTEKTKHETIVEDETDQDESLVEENYSNFSGVKLIYFEHCYTKNYAELFAIYETSAEPVTEELPTINEEVQDLNIQMPSRRSQRHINKSEKDVPISIIDKPDNLIEQLKVNVPTEEKIKEDINISETDTPLLNSSVVTENKPEDENKSVRPDATANAKISPNKELSCESSSPKIVKRLKKAEFSGNLEKELDTCSKQKQTEKESIHTAEYEGNRKRIKLKPYQPKTRRRRAISEPSKNDQKLLAEDDADKIMTKKKRSQELTKQKIMKRKKSKKESVGSENPEAKKESIGSENSESKKEPIGSESPEKRPHVRKIVLNREQCNKSTEVDQKKKRKKSKSLSEDQVSIPVSEKTQSKKCELVEIKESDTKIHASSPIAATKPKFKKIRRLVLNENEPPLFSQPDVMMKVKTDDAAKKDEKNEPEIKNQSPVDSDNLDKISPDVLNNIPDTKFATGTASDVSKSSASESFVESSQKTNKEAPETLSEYLSDEKDDFKDIDSENSLHIDESVGKIFEEENDDNSENEINEDTSNSPETKDVSFEDPTERKDDIPVDIDLNNSLPSADSKENEEDPDSDKPIAERKPRRMIKKKEFFEDITSRSSAQTKKSAGRQKVSNKKSEDDSKKGKRKSNSKAEVESEDDESEDDPTKLWCICRQPHNDRFMICCDQCEDWFHGSCVGVSRQQGRKLEKQQKEWLCPNCLKKGTEEVSVETANSQEKKVEVKETKIKAKKEESDIKSSVPKNSELPSKKEKVPDKINKTEVNREVNRNHDKQISSPAVSSLSSSSTPSLKTDAAPCLVSKKTIRNNVPKATNSSSPSSSNNNKKGLKEPLKIKQSCIICQAVVCVNSCYCSDKCLEKHAADCLAIYKEGKGASKGSDFDSQRIVVLDRFKGNMIAGDNAPTASSIVSWLKANPTYMIAVSSSASTNSKNTVQKKEVDSASTVKDKKEVSTESKSTVRLNVRKTLKNILMDRCKNADDIQVPEEDIRKIAVKIEEELNSYFKDNSFKYRAKYRSLMFNIKDPRNQGLFRKILKGNIPPDKLVRMSPEELASMELAKWREQENQHLLDMIKRVQLEQQSGSGLLLKKTHKGEVEIEDDFSVIDDIPKTSSKVLSGEPAEVLEKPEQEKEVVKDTTHHHRSHLFDLNCKICTGKIIPPPVDDKPKKVRVAHSIYVDLSSPTALDPVEKTVSRIVDGKSPLSSTGDDSMDQEPTSTVSIGSPEISVRYIHDSETATKAACSVWKGFIYMQDVAKFVTSAYKVSGPTEYLNMDVPDTIQVCGRIIPDQVWDYLGKIKQSGNKELIIIRFQAANDEEAVTYNSFYSYLSSRKRYGVVSNYSKKVKDFYILPLAATSPVPIVLMPFDGPGLPSPRPHLLLGVIVRHRSKQMGTSVLKKEKSLDGTTDKLDGSYTPPLETRSYTPPLPALQTDSSANVTPDLVYSPSLDLKATVSEEESDATQNSVASSADVKHKVDEEIYEPSYTPPLQILSSDSPKESEEDKPYDPEQDILNINNERKDSKSSPKEGVGTENLEKHKKILDALTRQVEETDRQVNALKQLISQPDDSDIEYHSPSTQSLDINSVASSGMSSFLDLPENLQDILNVVREKSFDKEKSPVVKGDVDMRISNLFKTFSSSYQAVKESEKASNSEEKNSSQGATPPLDDSEETSPAVVRPSDPRIKLRTSFQEPPFTSEETSSVSLSNMSASELVERAEKELADIEQFDKVQNSTQNIHLSQEKLASSNADKMSPAWTEFKEPPPPGIELSELTSQDSTYTKAIQSTQSPDNSLPSYSSPLIQETQQINPHFPPPSLPSAFPPPLPPGFTIQTPPPNLKNFPPPGVISTSFPPPPLPIVTKANDVNPINETWAAWNVPPQQSKDSTWQSRMPQWDESWKKNPEAASVDGSESSSHYYAPGTHESYYRGESSTEGRWTRLQRFGRNNWQKRPHRGGRWRGRRGSFHFNKNQKN